MNFAGHSGVCCAQQVCLFCRSSIVPHRACTTLPKDNRPLVQAWHHTHATESSHFFVVYIRLEGGLCGINHSARDRRLGRVLHYSFCTGLCHPRVTILASSRPSGVSQCVFGCHLHFGQRHTASAGVRISPNIETEPSAHTRIY